MHFAQIALKNLARRPLRAALTAGSIAVAVGTVVALVGLADGFERALRDLYRGSRIGLIVVRAGATRRLTSTLDESIGDRIGAFPGVAAVVPGLVDVVSFGDRGLYGVVVQGWIPETLAFDHLEIVAGRSLRRDDDRALLLGTIAAKNLGLGVGETLELPGGESARVVGTYWGAGVYEDGAIVMPLRGLQRLMGREGQVTGFSVILDDPADQEALERVRGRIEGLGENLQALTTEEQVRGLSEIRAVKALSAITAAIALVLGTLGVANAMVMAVLERTGEIGLLRALGWKARRVVRLILAEAMLLGLGGGVLGSVGAVGLVRLLTLEPNLNGLIDGRIRARVVLAGITLALLVGFLGGLWPARQATRLPPTVALRHE